MTDFSKKQLATILTALENQPCNPNSTGAAQRAISANALRLRLTEEQVFAAATSLLDGSMTADAWFTSLVAPAPLAPPSAPRKAKVRTEGTKHRDGTKQAGMLALLKRQNGATLTELMDLTGWQQHCVRGALSGKFKKQMGLEILSEKVAGQERTYRIVS